MTELKTRPALRRIREEQGMSRKRLARIVGVSAQAVIDWERGQYEPRLSRHERLEDALGVPVRALFAPEPRPDA